MKHWVKVAFLPRGRARKKFGGFGNMGVSTDFGCIFMYFYAFNTGMYSFGGLNPETSQILPPCSSPFTSFHSAKLFTKYNLKFILT